MQLELQNASFIFRDHANMYTVIYTSVPPAIREWAVYVNAKFVVKMDEQYKTLCNSARAETALKTALAGKKDMPESIL